MGRALGQRLARPATASVRLQPAADADATPSDLRCRLHARKTTRSSSRPCSLMNRSVIVVRCPARAGVDVEGDEAVVVVPGLGPVHGLVRPR